jgi:UDP-N-acetylmuramate dehydrogenase
MSVWKEAAEEARCHVDESVVEGEPLSRHCSFRIGGPAGLFLPLRDISVLPRALAFCRAKSIPFFVLGRGTNMLFPDSGYEGMVICIRAKGMQFNGERVVLETGVSLEKASMKSAKEGLAGLEFCGGIPGSVGGAAVMNAGAHGESMGALIEEVSGVNASGESVRFGKGDLEFGYRESSLQGFGGVVTEVVLHLSRDGPRSIEKRMKQWLEIRRSTQPVGARCAGSVFKNPEGDSAGRLIDLAGCKGLERGGAKVSERHANFIVNRGGATYSDVKGLIEAVRERVRKTHGVELKLEVIDLGDQS